MSDIKFSVVIPLYNKELSIRNTILSVLNQSYQNFEIVIINDGSTDNSVEAVKTIKDARIRLIHQENQGVSAARNRGIKESRYEWIAFLDSDDLWESNHLEEIVKMMNTFPNEKVYVTSFEYSDKRKMYKYKGDNPIFKIDNYFKEVINGGLIWTSIVIIHNSCFDVVGNFNINLNRGEDMDLWDRIGRKFSIIKSSEITAIYRVDAENRTSLSRDLKKCHYYYFDFDDMIDKFELNYCKQFLFYRIMDYILVKDYKTSWNLFKRYSSFSFVDFLKYFIDWLIKASKTKLKWSK